MGCRDKRSAIANRRRKGAGRGFAMEGKTQKEDQTTR